MSWRSAPSASTAPAATDASPRLPEQFAPPAPAAVLGNLLDPDSEISWVLANKRVFVLKEELGTRPRFFYFFDK
ncbi:MAG: hypothetical protein U1F87_12815 [Kiritimatiellia bacterium]